MARFAVPPALVATLLFLGHVATGTFVVQTTPNVTVRRGDTVTLPCWLSPEQSAEALDVQWHYDNKVDLLRYKDRIVSTPASHTGRVSFASRDAASGGLRVGDVSLELVNVTLRDSGEYTCYVSSNQNYDSAGVALAVTETGGPLRLSALSWSDPNGALTPGGVRYDRQSTGLSSVRSWLLVRSPSEIVCAVGRCRSRPKVERVTSV